MNFQLEKVPLSPNLAQRDNLPLKFGNFLKIAKKIKNPRGGFEPEALENLKNCHKALIITATVQMLQKLSK